MSDTTASSNSTAVAWTPPVVGSPCWIEIPATNVLRAKAFFTEVFNWTFRPPTESRPETMISLFNFPDPKLSDVGGGIVNVADADHKPGKGGSALYLWVNSIEDTCEKIKKAGGSVVQEKTAEGEHGWHAKFADTEGNVHGIYTIKT